MSFPTVAGKSIENMTLREPQVCLGPAYAQAAYKFFLTGTSTPANVYENGTLTTPFPITGTVTADNFGRFPPIYLDPSITYKAQLYDKNNTLVWTVDPYTAPLATTGTSSNSTYGPKIAVTGEVSFAAPNSGGTGITLTLNAGSKGTSPLKVSSVVAGNSTIIVNSSATTGAQTATFTATNKPGTATSSPAGWLPITCDGVQYYTPIWHGNNFTPYTPNPSAVGEVITGQSVVFGGNGVTTSTGGTASPGNWFAPSATGIGASYYINITKTSGLSGLAFSAAQGAWTNIGSGGLTVTSNAQAAIGGTYQLSSSVTGSPVVASGIITLSGNNGVQSSSYSGQPILGINGDGTASVNGIGASNWYLPTTSNIGSGYWINITRTGGSTGVNFTAAQGAWTNIPNTGMSIGINGTGGQFATGTYQIASDSAGVHVLGSGSVTLTNANVQSPNWTSAAPLTVGGDGTVNGGALGSWYAPTTTGIGAGFYLDLTRTGGTTGVNFSVAQGSWTNIGSGGLSINLIGYTGDVGTVTASGNWQISNSGSGSPVLGSGTISVSISGLTVIHVYTSGSGSEAIPLGTTTVTAEAWGSGAGGGAGSGGTAGGGGGGGAYARSVQSASSLGGSGSTFNYSVGAAGTAGNSGNASTITAGTVTGWTNITTNGGAAGQAWNVGAAGGVGGTASGGNAANTTGNAGQTGGGSTIAHGGAGISGTVSGDGSPYGKGGDSGRFGAGADGQGSAVVFYYT